MSYWQRRRSLWAPGERTTAATCAAPARRLPRLEHLAQVRLHDLHRLGEVGVLVLALLDVDGPTARKERAVARDARRVARIEGIGAMHDAAAALTKSAGRP